MTKRQMRHLCNQLRRCFKLSERFVKLIEFERNNRRHFAIAGYAIRSLDFFSGAISALSKREYTSVPTITRSGVEAFLYFVNLIKYENYDSLILLKVCKEKLRVSENAEKIEGLRFEVEKQEFKERKAEIEASIESLAEYAEDYKNLCSSIKKRFEAADMGELYLSMYNIFCGESHSDMMAIEGGNMTGDLSDWSFHRCKSPENDTLLYVNVLLDLMLAVPVRLNEFSDLKEEAALQEISDTVESTRALYDLPYMD